ncbi:acyltransferase family protein [Proteus mirabilis]|uniref:acyltransferase family protein n=2 Tax=Proteus mirabilis TaxID=584 RepID=UPI000F5D4C4B|nr:acyltransferase family protein [Proteus mirabilis]AZG98231.1 acyltransferase [Proteus mirabilis]MBG6040561.1 acyltransferase [Proteus mirabilis]MCI9766578.1 acyltransferase [Proteus mirabilis]MCI9770165.1 acyltransferase [Proteus mirabilis]MCI9773759.1 acyltransferase [Proteus mirabilis]
MQDKKFRNDINGLRAIAVLAVMLFHFVPSSLPGGFAGVDIFFVISGFLMTSIIFRGLKNNNFSLWNFIKARARRIVPALVTVISIVLALGYLFFEPLTYQLAGKHGFSSLLFISNITYAKEAGYFDSDSLSKIFLHTWSLSVEWQFYIIYPIILIILSKLFSINTLKKIVVISAIISFAFCIYFSSINKTLSYFLIYTRAWEMLFGGIVFLFPLSTTENKKRIIESLGLILIITSFFIFSDTDNWPSYNALLPVFGTYLCILANSYKSILSNKALQKIGLWSYSIYLVHWPLIVFCKKINIEINIITYFLVTISLSIIIYSLIERKRNYSYKFIFIYIFILILSNQISKNGFSYRVSDDKAKLSLAEYRGKYEGHDGMPLKTLYLNSNENDFEYILIGNSHARHYFHYIINNKLKVVSLAEDGCNSTKNYYSSYNKNICQETYNNTLKFIKENPNKKIIWATTWKDSMDGISRVNGKEVRYDPTNEVIEFINDIKGYYSDLYIIGDVQGTKQLSFECMARQSLTISKYFNISCNSLQKKIINKINDKLDNLSKSYHNVFFINAENALCNSETCLVIDNKETIYTDYHHLSKHGSNIVGSYIFNQIENK